MSTANILNSHSQNKNFTKKLLQNAICFVCVFIFTSILLLPFKPLNSFYLLRCLFPTIIFFITAKIALLGIKSVNLQTEKSTKVARIFTAILFIVVAIQFVGAFARPIMLNDTYAVYDISKYIFTDFGKMDMVRQNVINTQYQMAFPPFQPVLVAVFNIFMNLEVFAAVLMSIPLVVSTLYFLIKIGEKLGFPQVSIVVGFIFTFNLSYNLSYIGGGTIPVSIFFFTAIAYILVANKDNFSVKNSILVGILSGLGFLNRYDFLPVAIVLCFMLCFINKKFTLKYAICFALTFAVVSCPIFIYSCIRFDTFFMADNSRRLINITDTRPETFFTETTASQTLFSAPVLWFTTSLKRWLSVIKSCYSSVVSLTVIREIIVFSLVLVLLFKPVFKISFKGIWQFIEKYKIFFILLLPLLAQTASIVLTGYSDERYHLTLSLLISFVTFILLDLLCVKAFGNEKKGLLFLLLCIVAVFSKSPAFSFEATAKTFVTSLMPRTSSFLSTDNAAHLQTFSKSDANTRVIVDYHDESLNIPLFAATSGISTVVTPNNPDKKSIGAFVETFDANYLYTTNNDTIKLYKSQFSLEKTDDENLYKILF